MTFYSLHPKHSHTTKVAIAFALSISPMSTLAQVPERLQHDSPHPVHTRAAGQHSTATSSVESQNKIATPVETMARSFQVANPALETAQTDMNYVNKPPPSQKPLRNKLETIRLLPRRNSSDETQKNTAEANTPEFIQPLITVVSSLAVVLGLFFLVIWLFRRTAPRQSVRLPGEVFEFLGRAPLAGRQEMQLLRLGQKLLLLAVTPSSAQTLTEITDPDEVNRLSGICLNHSPSRITHSFRSIRETQQSQMHRPAYGTSNVGSDLRG